MVKILLGIALAVMVATAALGFFTHENVVKVQVRRIKAEQDLATRTTQLANTKTKLEKTEGELTAANDEIKKKGEEIAMQKGMIDEINNKLKIASEDLEKKTAEVTKLDAELKKVMGDKGDGTKFDPEALAKQIEELKTNYNKATTEAAEARALVESLTKQKKLEEDKVAVLELYKKSRELGLMRMGTSGRILAVNSGWNFVVLSIGDKQGAVMNATMLVVRGGEPIAKVRISSVEPSTSIADILPGSVRRGVTVQPGDNVVFEGRNPAAAALPPAAAGGLPPLPQH